MNFLTISNILWTLAIFLFVWAFYRVIWRPYLGVRFYLSQKNSAGYYSFSIKYFIDRLEDTEKRGDFFHYFKEILKKNPDTKFFASNWGSDPFVMLCDPGMIKGFLTQPDNYAKHESTIGLFADLMLNSILFSEGKPWKRSRKTLSTGFHHEFLRSTVDLVMELSEKKMEAIKTTGLKQVDVGGLFGSITGDLTGRFFFGRDLDHYTIDGLPLTKAITEVANEILINANSPGPVLLGTNLIRLQLFEKHRTLMKRIKGLREKTEQIIDETRKNPVKENNLLSLLISMTDKDDPSYTNKEIIEEFLAIFLGGTDTTAHTLAISTYFIAKHPEVYEKLREEAKTLFASPVTYDSLSKMEYTTAFIKECLRYFGPAGFIFNRVALRDHEIDGVQIKKGHIVNCFFNTLHHNQKYWTEPSKFIPERFLPNSGVFPDDKWKSEPFSFLPFSAGPRNCIGQHLAMVEAKIMVAKLVTKFKIRYPEDYKLRFGYKFTYDAWDPLLPEFIPI